MGAGFLASLFNSPRAQCLRIKGMFYKFPAKVHLLFLVLLFTVFLLLSGIFCFLFQLHRYLCSFKK